MMKTFFNIILNATVTLPAMEISVLLVTIACCLVLKTNKTGLVVAYLFLYRWVWLIMKREGHDFLMPYLIFGVIVAILTVIGMLRSTDK